MSVLLRPEEGSKIISHREKKLRKDKELTMGNSYWAKSKWLSVVNQRGSEASGKCSLLRTSLYHCTSLISPE